MDGYLQISLLIMVCGIVSGIIYGYKSKEQIKGSLLFVGLYYLCVSAFRMLQGHGIELLGHAFMGKGLSGYIKAVGLMIVVGAVVIALRHFFKDFVDKVFANVMSVFYALTLVTVACYSVPSLFVTTVEGVISVALGLLLYIFKIDILRKSNDKSHTYFWISTVVLWLMLFVVNGPAEIYAFNSSEFPFKYSAFLSHLLVFGLIVITITCLAGKYLLGDVVASITSLIIFGYSVLSYIQIMFLNGKMDDMQGGAQTWESSKLAINIAIWVVVAIIICVVAIGVKKKESVRKAGTAASLVISALQLLSIVSLLLGGSMKMDESRQLSNRDVYKLSKNNNNIVVFILDTYDGQMVNYVNEHCPGFYDELHDFTYYSKMTSRFNYTDGSLPYLMTGILVEDNFNEEQYLQSHFINTIADYGYDIQTFTDKRYVQYLDAGLIKNYIDEWYVKLEHGRIVNQIVDCVRYKAVPFALKKYYTYSDFDLVECIDDTDVYFFGSDSKFYWNLYENGLQVEDTDKGEFDLYHLNGAHIPYHLTEEMTIDSTNQDALAQWKACMRIVYEYVEQMKKEGVYDNSTIIIMADHGPGTKQREPLSGLGINFNDDLHPIFFMKRANESHDSLIEVDKPTSHDDFFGTIIKLINEEDGSYGAAIWE